MRPPPVLVTGARGYLGGRLVRHLAAQGRPVVGTSRQAKAPPKGWPDQASLVTLDLNGAVSDLTKALQGVDSIVHLSAANEHDCARDPDRAVIDTGLGTRHLLEAAIAAGVRRFIFLSTIHVYGAPLPARIDETTPARPAHPYAISHRLGEDFVLAAQAAGTIEGVVVRLSNGIGAPAWVDVDRWTLVGNDLARQVIETGQMTLNSPGLQWRDFITLHDYCVGLSTLLDAPADRLGDGLFNLGGRLPLRILDVAESMASAARDVLGRDPVIQRPSTDPAAPAPQPIDFSVEKLEDLGFSPTGDVHLADELRACLRLLDESAAR